MEKRLGENYKWIILVGCTLLMMVIYGIVNNVTPIYIIPICEEFGFSRSAFSLTITSYGLIVMFAALNCTKVYQRFGLLASMRISCIILCISYCMMSTAKTLFSFFFFNCVNGIMVGISCMTPCSIIAKQWFKDRAGFAVGIYSAGSGVGAFAFMLLAEKILSSLGWRATYIIMGCIVGVVSLFVTFVLIRIKEDASAAEIEEKDSEMQSKPSDLDSKKLLALMFCIAVVGFVNYSITSVITPYAQDVGYSLKYAARLSSATMIILAIGKLLEGMLVDRIGMRKMTTIAFATLGLASVCYFLFPKLGIIIMIPAFLGTAFGCSYSSVGISLLSPSVAEPKDVARITGKFVGASHLGIAIAPLVANIIFDYSGSYIPLYILGTLLIVISTPIMLRRIKN